VFDPIGDKETLIKRIEHELFYNYLYKRQADDELKEVTDTELESLMRFSKHTKLGPSIEDMENCIMESWEKFASNEMIQEKEWPWDIVKEICRQNRRFTYLDIHRGLSQFMRPTMVFYNHCLEGDSLTAVCAFPFTDKTIKAMSEPQVFALGKMLGYLPENDEDKQFDIIEVMRQKLFDMIYAVEDAPRMHGILPCQNKYKKCHNIASCFCSNKVCKLCCQDYQHRTPCTTHDSHDQFFRQKIRELSNFEARFDVKTTLRLSMRKLIRLYELEKVFDGYKIDWEKAQFFYDLQTHRISYIYIVCENQQEALRIMKQKSWFTSKLNRYHVSLTALSGKISDANELFTEPENVLAILKPHSILEVVEELPKGDELYKKLIFLVQAITGLDPKNYRVEPDFNPITGDQDYTRFFVTLPSVSFVDKLYNSQPFFGCLIAHKMTHVELCPYPRYSSQVCLMCNTPKNEFCQRDMCTSCCSKQKNVQRFCGCSSQKIQEVLAKKKELARTSEVESYCNKCYERSWTNESTRMCTECYSVQAIKISDNIEDELSAYDKEFLAMDPVIMARMMLSLVGEMHIKFRHELKRGKYDWFKPICDSNIEDSMTKANRELQEVVDNGHLIRGHAPKKFTKEGKIFTFQANDAMAYRMDEETFVREDVDHNGEPFVEYIFDCPIGEETTKSEKWIVYDENKIRNYNESEYLNYVNMPNLEVKNNFQIFLFGLDRSNLTIKELYQEIHIKLKMLVGEVPHKNIMIIDPESIESDILNYQDFRENADVRNNLRKLGRVALVQFPSLLDAYTILTANTPITLPLFDGSNNQPEIVCSSNFMQFVSQTDSNEPHFFGLVNGFAQGGDFFKAKNKEIEDAHTHIREVFSGPNKKNSRGRGRGGNRGRGGDRGGDRGDRGGYRGRGGDRGRGGYNKSGSKDFNGSVQAS